MVGGLKTERARIRVADLAGEDGDVGKGAVLGAKYGVRGGDGRVERSSVAAGDERELAAEAKLNLCPVIVARRLGDCNRSF